MSEDARAAAKELLIRGNQLCAGGQVEAGLAEIERAIGAWGDFAEAHQSAGVALLRLGRFAEAIEALERAVTARAEYPEALNNLGIALRLAGRLDDAIAAYRRAVAMRPGFGAALRNLGDALTERGEIEEAIEWCRAALAIGPDDAHALLSLGNALQTAGRAAEAAAALRRAVAIEPRFPEALASLGHVLWDLEQDDQAIEACRAAIALRPNYAEAFSNLSMALWRSGKIDEAVVAAQRAVDLRGDWAGAWINLGIALAENGEYERAMAAQDQALKLLGTPATAAARADAARCHNSRGGIYKDTGKLEAAAEFRRSLELDPASALVHWNLSMVLLGLGDYAAGFAEYEWRMRLPSKTARRELAEPRWDGEALGGRRVLLYGEQGFGDVIQMARFVPMVARRGGSAVVQVRPELRRLMELSGMGDVVDVKSSPGRFDVQCSLLSLPHVLGVTIADLPGRVPYLAADGVEVARWRERIGESAGLNVGLIWSGNPRQGSERHRTVPLEMLGLLGRVQGVRLFSLQKGAAGAAAKNPPAGMELVDWTDELGDFADTAALMSAMDLVLTSDTGPAHLAGALGRPTWIMLSAASDWRWLRGREDSPWYPTVRLFRQRVRGDWQDVVRTIAEEMSARARRIRK